MIPYLTIGAILGASLSYALRDQNVIGRVVAPVIAGALWLPLLGASVGLVAVCTVLDWRDRLASRAQA